MSFVATDSYQIIPPLDRDVFNSEAEIAEFVDIEIDIEVDRCARSMLYCPDFLRNEQIPLNTGHVAPDSHCARKIEEICQNLIGGGKSLMPGYVTFSTNYPSPSATQATYGVEFDLGSNQVRPAEEYTSERSESFSFFPKIGEGVCEGMCEWFLLTLMRLENETLDINSESLEEHIRQIAVSLEEGASIATMLLQFFPNIFINRPLNPNTRISFFNFPMYKETIKEYSISKLKSGVYMVGMVCKDKSQKFIKHRMLLFKLSNEVWYFFDPNCGLKYLPGSRVASDFFVDHLDMMIGNSSLSLVYLTKFKVTSKRSRPSIKSINPDIFVEYAPEDNASTPVTKDFELYAKKIDQIIFSNFPDS